MAVIGGCITVLGTYIDTNGYKISEGMYTYSVLKNLGKHCTEEAFWLLNYLFQHLYLRQQY